MTEGFEKALSGSEKENIDKVALDNKKDKLQDGLSSALSHEFESPWKKENIEKAALDYKGNKLQEGLSIVLSPDFKPPWKVDSSKDKIRESNNNLYQPPKDNNHGSILSHLKDSLKDVFTNRNKQLERGKQSETGIPKEIRYELIKNKEDGIRRENEVEKELSEKYPESEGYKIEKEVYLRDKDGNIVVDPVTGEKRRIDFVVTKDGKVVDSIEVTSKTANKDEQMGKEKRIREEGGNFIKDSDGNIIEIPENVQTRIERRD
jgi:hypothetical protein